MQSTYRNWDNWKILKSRSMLLGWMSGRIKDRRPKIKHWLQNKNDRNQVHQMRKKTKNSDITAKKKKPRKTKIKRKKEMIIRCLFLSDFVMSSLFNLEKEKKEMFFLMFFQLTWFWSCNYYLHISQMIARQAGCWTDDCMPYGFIFLLEFFHFETLLRTNYY